MPDRFSLASPGPEPPASGSVPPLRAKGAAQVLSSWPPPYHQCPGSSGNSSASRHGMKRVRKQVFDLTVEDLDRYPVWEFALDEEGDEGQDEATVRPYEPHGPL